MNLKYHVLSIDIFNCQCSVIYVRNRSYNIRLLTPTSYSFSYRTLYTTASSFSLADKYPEFRIRITAIITPSTTSFSKRSSGFEFSLQNCCLISKYAIFAYLIIYQNCGFFYCRRRQIIYLYLCNIPLITDNFYYFLGCLNGCNTTYINVSSMHLLIQWKPIQTLLYNIRRSFTIFNGPIKPLRKCLF